MIRFRRHVLSGAVLVAMAALPMASHATTGYFALGYGTKEMGMAGATSAAPQSAVAAAVNPAGMAFVGSRADLGVRAFIPIREAELDSSNFGGGVISSSSSDRLFMFPAGGLNWQINDQWSAGLTFFGNGGLNTTYGTNIYDKTAAVLGAAQQGGPAAAKQVFDNGIGTGLPDTGILNVDLQQLMVIPSAAFKWDDKYSIGGGPIIAMQKVEVNGLGDFQCFTTTAQQGNAGCQPGGSGFPQAVPQGSSNYPGLSPDLTDNGDEMRWGFGFRGGIQAKVTPTVSLAVAGATKVYMNKYEKYSELFAEQGDLDIPANITAGIGWNAMPNLLLTFDYQHIFYEGVAAISNPGPGLGLSGNLPAQNLGNDDGFGFGWQDINVFRVGTAYDTTLFGKGWTFRGGLAYNDQPIPESQVLFNILAPATVQWHLTLGASFRPTDYAELNLGWMWAFNDEVSTDQTAFGGPAGSGTNVPGSISMYQTSVDMGISVLF